MISILPKTYEAELVAVREIGALRTWSSDRTEEIGLPTRCYSGWYGNPHLTVSSFQSREERCVEYAVNALIPELNWSVSSCSAHLQVQAAMAFRGGAVVQLACVDMDASRVLAKIISRALCGALQDYAQPWKNPTFLCATSLGYLFLSCDVQHLSVGQLCGFKARLEVGGCGAADSGRFPLTRGSLSLGNRRWSIMFEANNRNSVVAQIAADGEGEDVGSPAVTDLPLFIELGQIELPIEVIAGFKPGTRLALTLLPGQKVLLHLGNDRDQPFVTGTLTSDGKSLVIVVDDNP